MRRSSDASSAGETAAFLVFSEASGGTLFIHWSVAGHINGALAGFATKDEALEDEKDLAQIVHVRLKLLGEGCGNAVA